MILMCGIGAAVLCAAMSQRAVRAEHYCWSLLFAVSSGVTVCLLAVYLAGTQ